MSRTHLVLGLLVAFLAAAACSGRSTAAGKRVIVLGFDGLDYDLTRSLIDKGRLPNFARLAASGGFAPLETSIPPQSPVAWSTFITGLDPGGHGIFDFIHRDPKTMVPYLSTSRAEGSSRAITVGEWQFPISGGSVELLRQGQPFWEVLEARGIETTIIRMPANFPPSGTATRELSGMGTPDLLGTYGTFSFYTSEPFAFGGRALSGGTLYPVTVESNVVRAALHGPDNPFRKVPEKVSADFTLFIDAERPVAKLVVGDEERVLAVGEWSDWLPVDFDLRVPLQSVRGMARFYLKQVRPYVEMYVSPINFDPMSPAMPVSEPAEYAAELAEATGRFYTQGMPEDTKGLRQGVLTRDEFLSQARLAGEENRVQYRYVLDRFADGLLFYYFGNVDQIAHMMWRARDPGHPAHDPSVDPQICGRHRRALRRSRPHRRRHARRDRRRRNAHRAFRPRLHLMAALVPPQHVAEAARVPDTCESVARGRSGLLWQRRLDTYARVRHRTQWSLRQCAGAGDVGLCRARRSRACHGRDRRQAPADRSILRPASAPSRKSIAESRSTPTRVTSIARQISWSATRRARAARMSPRSEAFHRKSSSTTRIPGAATIAWTTRRCPACFCRIGRCASPHRRSAGSLRRSWQSSASRSSL